ncbi:MAG TPA: response regulator [Bacteroidales bacterium]|nr:response regulator [Bacteroidales bacterium]
MKSKNGNGKILYVDDSRENLDGFYYTFYRTFDIFTATNGAEALEIIGRESIQLVITDQRMPDITGIELIDIIKKEHPNIIFILITAYTDLEVMLDAINKAGVFRFMVKPWEKSDMRHTITNALETFTLKEANKELIDDLITFNKALESTNITLQKEIEERKKVEEQLRNYQLNLENIIKDRTEELDNANKGLTLLNEQLQVTNDRLNEENAERQRAQTELVEYKNHLELLVQDKTRQIIESEEKYKTVFESSVEPIVILSRHWTILKANSAFFKTIGYADQDLANINAFDLLPPKNKEKAQLVMDHILDHGYFRDIETDIIGFNGLKSTFNINARLISYEKNNAVLIVGQNITDKKNLQKKIYQAMLEGEEKERQKLANDLHDEVGPLLSSLKLYIDALKNINLDPQTQRTFLANSFDLVTSTIASIREISNSLSPAILAKFGLIASLNTLIEKTIPLIGVNFYNDIYDMRFPHHIEIIIYRIIKELINNTIKHANATLIEIDISLKSDFLLLYYADNGCGFVYQKPPQDNKKGLGLNSILNRAKSIDATAEFVTAPGNGLKFYLEIPIKIKPNDKTSNN